MQLLGPVIRVLALIVVACAASGVARSAHAQSPGEQIDLSPAEQARWTARNVVAGVSTVFGLYGYWYQESEVRIETVPPDAQIGLYYLRSNFQKRFERVSGPILVQFPSRIDSTSADTFRVRVSADGFLVKEERFRVHDLPDKIVVSLDPLPNALTFIGQTHLGARTTLTVRTSEEPQVRIGKFSNGQGFSVSLVETANQLVDEPKIASGHIESLELQQIGEDLLMRVATNSPDLELRSRASRDAVRNEHVMVFDLLPKGTPMIRSNDVVQELANVRFSPGDRCGARFEQVFRERLDPRIVARAFRGAATIPAFYQKEAMRKLGRLDRGRVHSVSGDAFRIGSPIELEMALQNALQVRDYFAVLGAIARNQAEPSTFLRSLVAPEQGQEEFDSVYAEADRAFHSCL